MDVATRTIEWIWVGGLTALPLAVVVALAARFIPRPATRHVLWSAVLISFLTPAIGITLWRTYGAAAARLWQSAKSSVAAPAKGESAVPRRSEVAQGRKDAPASNAGGVRPANPGSPVSVAARLGEQVLQSSDSALSRIVFNAPLRAAITVVRTMTLASSSTPPTSPSDTGLVATLGEPLPAETAPPASLGVVSGVRTRQQTFPVSGIPIHSSPLPERAAAHTATASPSVLSGIVKSAGLVRDALVQSPPVHAAWWVLGASGVVAVALVRTWRMRRGVRRGGAAVPEVERMVRAAAYAVGLKRLPRVVMSDDRLSPMVCGWWNPALVLPAPLWRNLGDSARRAIIVHELAHLKRRDHWVCAADALVAVLYWWHPVAWWVRDRLHEDAEAACDAWVTSLMPSGRKSYAEALVSARCYAGVRGRSLGPQLSVVSGRSSKLSRRITMVMTQRVAPSASRFGLVAALIIGAMGAIVTPGLACPPDEEKDKQKAPKAAKAPKAPKAPKAAKAARTPKPATAPTPAQGDSEFFGEAPALEAMEGEHEHGEHPTPPTPGEPAPEPEAFMRPSGRSTAPGATTLPPSPPDRPFTMMGALPRTAPGQPQPLMNDGETVERMYELPSGKLDAFYELMARSDVPIWVRREGEGIAIQATLRQHEVFEMFFRMINPDGEAPVAIPRSDVSGALLRERALMQQSRALAESRESLQVAAHELQREQAARERAVERLEQRAEQAQEQHETLAERAEEVRQEIEAAQDARRREALVRELQTVEQRRQSREQQAQEIEQQARQAAEQAEELSARLGEIEQKLEEIEARLEEAKDAQGAANEEEEPADKPNGVSLVPTLSAPYLRVAPVTYVPAASRTISTGDCAKSRSAVLCATSARRATTPQCTSPAAVSVPAVSVPAVSATR